VAWFDLVLGAVFGVWCGCKTNKQRFGAMRVLCGYIYQANAWYGGGRVFEIEFQFQLVLSLVLGYGAVQGLRRWC